MALDENIGPSSIQKKPERKMVVGQFGFTQEPSYNFGYEGFSRKLIWIARSPMRC